MGLQNTTPSGPKQDVALTTHEAASLLLEASQTQPTTAGLTAKPPNGIGVDDNHLQAGSPTPGQGCVAAVNSCLPSIGGWSHGQLGHLSI